MFGRVSSENIWDKRDKAPTKFLIRAAGCPYPYPLPPFVASFVSGNCINLTIPLCAIIFHPIMSLLWGGLIFTSLPCLLLLFSRTQLLCRYLKLDQHQPSIVSTSINTHLLATENATWEIHFTESKKYGLKAEKYALQNQKQPPSINTRFLATEIATEAINWPRKRFCLKKLAEMNTWYCNVDWNFIMNLNMYSGEHFYSNCCGGLKSAG